MAQRAAGQSGYEHRRNGISPLEIIPIRAVYGAPEGHALTVGAHAELGTRLPAL